MRNLIFLSALFLGCGGGSGIAYQPCPGGACTCNLGGAAPSCECTRGDCSWAGEGQMTCNVSNCKRTCGNGCVQSCTNSFCDVYAGDNSTVQCERDSCEITVGAGSTITCTGAVCNIRCNATCTASCPGGQCTLTCPSGTYKRIDNQQNQTCT